ncbi:MAG: ATP-grasp domain-containing protein [bacterium]|nr:ATP-grasp domain-containing protein [bacterium]
MSLLWVLSAGPEACPIIRRARELGIRVVTSDRRPDAPGMKLANHAVVASVYDSEETLAAALSFAAQNGAPDGVLCAAADAPLTAARLCEAFDLPGVSLETGRLTSDKLAMKERLAADGIPVPWFRPVSDASELSTWLEKEGPTLVIKPVDSRGARGVVRLTGELDPGWAFETARAHSPTGRVMVERFLVGPQVSTESLVLDCEVATPGFADRNYEHLQRFAPFVVENGGELPSCLAPDVQARTRQVVADAARSLGLTVGVAKGDIVVHDGQPVVIELAARLSGGYLCSHHIPLSTGVDFVGAAIRQAIGESVEPAELVPRQAMGVAQRFVFPEPGRVTAVHGEAEVAARPDIALVEVRVGKGGIVGPVEHHPSRAGMVIARAEDREAAIRAADAAAANLVIETEPAP